MADDLIPISRARELVLAAIDVLPSEPVPLGIALDRVLATDVVAATDVPSFENSAMDGFAIRHDPSSRELAIVDEARAGRPAARAVGPGETIRISTGAPLPKGADTVVPIEHVEERDGRIVVPDGVVAGQHVRHAGEDLRAGAVVLRAGTPLDPAALAVAIGAGAGTVACARRPRVAVVCTGDELRAPGEPLGPGEIHNSNGPMLAALARRAGAEVVVDERVGDDRAATEAAFAAALERADVVIASGGVSVGPHDHVKPALAALGVEERFWGVALQPGKPTWFGTGRDRLVFGLPGNPVSSFVTFTLFVRPALRALQGAAALPPRARATLTETVRQRWREQAVRVALDERDGTLRATTTGPQGSHVTASLLDADALAFVPPGTGALTPGTAVEVERI